MYYGYVCFFIEFRYLFFLCVRRWRQIGYFFAFFCAMLFCGCGIGKDVTLKLLDKPIFLSLFFSYFLLLKLVKKTDRAPRDNAIWIFCQIIINGNNFSFESFFDILIYFQASIKNNFHSWNWFCPWIIIRSQNWKIVNNNLFIIKIINLQHVM